MAFKRWMELLRCVEVPYGLHFYLYPVLGALGVVGSVSGTAYGAFAFLIVLVNVHDGFAVGFGRLLGRTPMCSHISPQKTWEGACGALAICLLVGYAIRFFVPTWQLWQVFAGAALIAVFSVIGDLIASSLKREAQIKDFGTALGATGGFLDRFDSLLFVVPVFYAFVRLLTGGLHF